MDDRGKFEWFLGMQINEDSEKITLDQQTYTESVLEKFSMQDSNPSKTPAENKLKVVKAAEVEQLVDETFYRSLVRSLLYIAKQTRPDIVWIVNVLSRFMDKPANSNWLAGKRVLRYLQATKSLRLVYPRDRDYSLIGESDADWSGNHDDRKSTTGYFFKLGFSGGAVSWKTKKQQTVALSSCEAEYQGLAAAVQEATFLRSLMCEMGYQQMQATVTTKAASNWLPTLLCLNDPGISIRIITSYEKKLMTTQFNWSTRQLINWQQFCWQNQFHKWKWSNIESNYWVNCRFFLTTKEKSEWGCWGIELWKNSWAIKLKLLFYSSSKSRRNKLTWFGSKLNWYGYLSNELNDGASSLELFVDV